MGMVDRTRSHVASNDARKHRVRVAGVIRRRPQSLAEPETKFATWNATTSTPDPLRRRAIAARTTVRIEDDLYVRDYDKCIMCFRCVAACGPDAQNTFAIDVAGRGLTSTIATEYDITLPESACVYCGNCVGVCPTGALIFTTEYEMRRDGTWDEDAQTVTTTICSFCGIGCNLDLHVQDNRIVKVTSPLDHPVTEGHLCIKGRFGYSYVQRE